jgi:DNA (cytosine-5)-methyltransferase 1
LRESGQHESESESGKERLSERNEVRKPGESSDVLSEMQLSFADTVSGGSESFSQSGRVEGDRNNTIPKQSEWSQQTEFNNGFLRFSRIASDTDCNRGREIHEHLQSSESDGQKPLSNGGIRDASDTSSKRLERQNESRSGEGRERMHIWRNLAGCCGADDLRPEERWKTFPTVSAVHRGNDGIPFDVDSLAIPFSKWRTESIKAYGNAIVPQVMYRIFEAIEALENDKAL